MTTSATAPFIVAATIGELMGALHPEPTRTRRGGGEVARCPICRHDGALELRTVKGGLGSVRCAKGCAGEALAERLGVRPPPSRSRVPTPRGGTGTNVVPGTTGNDGNDGNHKGSSLGASRSRENARERHRERQERPLFEPVGAFLDRTANLPAPTWLIPDLVPDAGRLFVVSAPNAGKTFLALLIAKSAAAAGRPVYLVLEEGGARRMGDRFRNLDFDRALPIHVAHLRGVQLGDRRVAEELRAVLQAHEAPVLALDPFASVFGGDENDTRAMNGARAQLDELANVNPRALLAVFHHTSKAGERGDSGPGMYAARGSSILPAWADVQLNLKHDEVPRGAGRVAFTAKVEKHRDGERGLSKRVSITLGTGEILLEDVELTNGRDDRGTRVLEIAVAEPGLSRDKLAQKAGGRKADTLAVVDKLAGEGALDRRGDGYHARSLRPIRRGFSEPDNDESEEATA